MAGRHQHQQVVRGALLGIVLSWIVQDDAASVTGKA